MEYLEFILYGLIQGLTEFIPVSSTAHLKIISLFFGFDDPGRTVSAIIQFGSVLALFCYFRRDIVKLKSQYSRKSFDFLFQERILKSILIGTIPIIVFGGIIKLFVPNFFDNVLRSNLSIAIFSFLMAIFMYLADINKGGFINLKNHNYSDSLLIGLSQAFAILPGVSRSGVTISTALVSGWDRSDAAKFSFLLGVPAISFAAAVELISSFNEFLSFSFPLLIVGLTTSFFSSLFTIDFLLKYYSSNGLKLFIIYRLAFGVVIFLNL